MCWATFWAIFSRTRPVTLLTLIKPYRSEKAGDFCSAIIIFLSQKCKKEKEKKRKIKNESFFARENFFAIVQFFENG
jgi:hypothetical protein